MPIPPDPNDPRQPYQGSPEDFESSDDLPWEDHSFRLAHNRLVRNAVNQKNKLIQWDDGHDHSDEFIVVRRADVDLVLSAVDALVGETVKLSVVASVVDALDAALTRAKNGHTQLNEQVLTRLVSMYQEVLNT